MDKNKQKPNPCLQLRPKSPPKPKPKPKATAASRPCSRETPLARVPSAPSGTNSPSKDAACPTAAAAAASAGAPACCQKRFKHLIHKHQIKNEQLERREDHLLRRLEMLQCSMPVMLAQVCQKPEALLQLLERQFSVEGEDGDEENACRITPSRHYDCRVREIEAQRKEACRRAEEARTLWQEREEALRNQKARVELARKQQHERKQRVEQLAAEARKLQKQSGRGKEKDWMMESEVSLGSNDLECLRQLETLVEAESCKRRHLSELEAQNEMFMRVIARAEQMQPPRDTRRDDELNKQLECCRAELAKYRDVERKHKDAQAVPRCVSRGQSSARIQSPKPSSDEKACETQTVQALSKVTWAGVKTATKDAEARVECAPACVGRYYSEANKAVLAKPEKCDKKSQARANVTSLALSADIGTPPGQSKCECGHASVKQSKTSCPDLAGKAKEELTKKKSLTKVASTTEIDKNLLKIPRSEIQSCLSIVNDMHGKLAGSEKFPHVCKDFQNLKNIFASALGLDINKLEKEAAGSCKSRKEQKECDGVSFVSRGKKEQQMNKPPAITCECAQDAALIGKNKCKEDKKKENTPLARKSETDNAAGLICKCEPVEQKDQASSVACRTEKAREKCDRAVSTDREDKKKAKCDAATAPCKEVKVKLNVDDKAQKRICPDDAAGKKDKQTDCVAAPTRKCDLLQATIPLSNIDGEKCGATAKQKPQQDDAAHKCKEQKGKCNDIVAALNSKCEKGKQPDAAPTVKCKTAKKKDEEKAKCEAKCAEAMAAAKEEKRKRKEAAALSKALSKEKLKLKGSDTALLAKKDTTDKKCEAKSTGKMDKEKPKSAAKGDKEKPKSADKASKAKGKKDESKQAARPESPKDRPKSCGNKETISKAKILCCDKTSPVKTAPPKPNKNDQQSLRKYDSKTKLGSGAAQPCGSDQKLTRNCESKKSIKAASKPTAQPCKSVKTPTRQCQSLVKKPVSPKTKICDRKKSTISLRPARVVSVEADCKIAKIAEGASSKSVKKPERNKSKQSMKSRDKSSSRHDPKKDEEKTGKSPDQLNPSENFREEAGEHESEDKQPPPECLETGEPNKKTSSCAIAKEVRSVEGSGGESEYFECCCDLPPCPGAPARPCSQPRDEPPAALDKTPFEELCICEPLVKLVDKWQRGAAPGKLYNGCPPDRQRIHSRRAQIQGRRSRPRARRRQCRRHHPYKRAASSTCLGRPRLSAKCACSGLDVPSSTPSVCRLSAERRRRGCRRCGGPISKTSLCGLMQAAEDPAADSQRSQSDNAHPEEATCSGKRDQGVLAKLPKPPKCSSKRKKREQLEGLFEGASRQATEIFDVISSGESSPPRRRIVGPSCTCLKNHCEC